MMTKTGMLIVTNPNKLIRYLPKIQKEIKNTLYIQFLTKCHYSFLKNGSSNNARQFGPVFSNTVINLYRSTINLNCIDVRVLLGNFRDTNSAIIATKKQIEVVYLDEVFNLNEMQGSLMKCITNRSSSCQVVSLGDREEFTDVQLDECTSSYDNVVLGGTFDRLHAGHKILLSEAVLRCQKKLTVGVTNTEMLKTKKLWELVEPCETRINKIRNFLEDVEPTLEYNIVPIEDMYGPTRSDPTLQLLIVSSETIKGGVKVNEVRKENGLQPLLVHSVDLLLNPCQEDEEEDKISSSNGRLRLLGTLLRKPEIPPDLAKWPYIIGLIGGIASGKTSICKRLEELGAAHINCDEIGHSIYKKGTPAYDVVVDTFGTNILDENKEISRKTLANIVFNQKDGRFKLNNIMWPAILKRSKEMALDFYKKGKHIVVLEAAALLEAGWASQCHEIWSCVIPPEEAVKRLQCRNQLTEEQAKARISSLPSNSELVKHANIVFCTLWNPDFTQKQVYRAWQNLHERLDLSSDNLIR